MTSPPIRYVPDAFAGCSLIFVDIARSPIVSSWRACGARACRAHPPPQDHPRKSALTPLGGRLCARTPVRTPRRVAGKRPLPAGVRATLAAWGMPQVNFALDTYECIVLYPGAAGRVLPAETVQRLQAEHAEHMQALQRGGIILVAGSVDGPAREPEPPIGFGLARTGSVDDVRSVLEADPRCRPGSTGWTC
ncbi:hypothetical protein NKG94_48080 [Micromonospora sp. M12]